MNIRERLRDRFPPLYECSQCGASVKVTGEGEGQEPKKEFSCGHVKATIYANRRVELRGVGTMLTRTARVKLTVRQLLSALTGRSI